MANHLKRRTHFSEAPNRHTGTYTILYGPASSVRHLNAHDTVCPVQCRYLQNLQLGEEGNNCCNSPSRPGDRKNFTGFEMTLVGRIRSDPAPASSDCSDHGGRGRPPS
ncbi:hypothetical protein NDU88_004726 [Pleurodeles waltl]|uniref:Uncharacterized protein n=1 Tax=Pleurodeles waltl TaxID=8319 RepID=A0AAV7TV55_PLEWA|nr:hypothetical protein NDU88_004726 [Pleurodeles waltl]